MIPYSSELHFKTNLTEKLMPFLTAILVFMSVLMLMLSMHFRDWLNDWDKSTETQISIQVMPDITDKIPLEEKVDQIITALSSYEIVKVAREVDPQEIEELLSPWLKSGFTDLGIEIPALINVELHKNDDETIKTMKEKIESRFPSSVVEYHQEWLKTLNSFSSIARKISMSFSSLCFLAIILLIIQITVLSLNSQGNAINLLSILGANDKFIATRFQKHILKFAAIGSGVGFTLALIVIYFIAFTLKKIDAELFQHFLPGDGQFLILILAPIFLTFIMGMTARFTALYQLKWR